MSKMKADTWKTILQITKKCL